MEEFYKQVYVSKKVEWQFWTNNMKIPLLKSLFQQVHLKNEQEKEDKLKADSKRKEKDKSNEIDQGNLLTGIVIWSATAQSEV